MQKAGQEAIRIAIHSCRYAEKAKEIMVPHLGVAQNRSQSFGNCKKRGGCYAKAGHRKIPGDLGNSLHPNCADFQMFAWFAEQCVIQYQLRPVWGNKIKGNKEINNDHCR